MRLSHNVFALAVVTRMGFESESDLDSDIDGPSTGHNDDVGEDRDVLDRELHTLAREGRFRLNFCLAPINLMCYRSRDLRAEYVPAA